MYLPGMRHPPTPGAIRLGTHAKATVFARASRRLHRDYGLSSCVQATRGIGMDLRNQAGWLSARGCAKCWSNDPFFPAAERLEPEVPLYSDHSEFFLRVRTRPVN